MKSQIKKRAYDEAGLSPPEEKPTTKKAGTSQKQTTSQGRSESQGKKQKTAGVIIINIFGNFFIIRKY